MKEIEIPFGAFDSELQGFEYTIPDGYTAEIVDGKIIVKKEESNDESIRKLIVDYLKCRLPDAGEFAQEYHIALNWLKKQQKSADTPKFKVGDWVINDHGFVMQIVDVQDSHYVYMYEGKELSTTIEQMEDSCHLWTIKDAKDGDVLTWDDNKCIAIFKEIYDKYSFKGHGGVGPVLGMFSMGGFYDIKNAHPATKEQRDFLIQKIKESEYWWGAEKTELREIKSDSVESEKDDKVFKDIYEDLHAYYGSQANANMFSSKKELYEKKWGNAKKWLEEHVVH